MPAHPTCNPSIEELTLPLADQFTLFNGLNYRRWKGHFDRNMKLTGMNKDWIIENVDCYMDTSFQGRLNKISDRHPVPGESLDEADVRRNRFWKNFEKTFYQKTKTVQNLEEIMLEPSETGGSFISRFCAIKRDISEEKIRIYELETILRSKITREMDIRLMEKLISLYGIDGYSFEEFMDAVEEAIDFYHCFDRNYEVFEEIRSSTTQKSHSEPFTTLNSTQIETNDSGEIIQVMSDMAMKMMDVLENQQRFYESYEVILSGSHLKQVYSGSDHFATKDGGNFTSTTSFKANEWKPVPESKTECAFRSEKSVDKSKSLIPEGKDIVKLRNSKVIDENRKKYDSTNEIFLDLSAHPLWKQEPMKTIKETPGNFEFKPKITANRKKSEIFKEKPIHTCKAVDFAPVSLVIEGPKKQTDFERIEPNRSLKVEDNEVNVEKIANTRVEVGIGYLKPKISVEIINEDNELKKDELVKKKTIYSNLRITNDTNLKPTIKDNEEHSDKANDMKLMSLNDLKASSVSAKVIEKDDGSYSVELCQKVRNFAFYDLEELRTRFARKLSKERDKFDVRSLVLHSMPNRKEKWKFRKKKIDLLIKDVQSDPELSEMINMMKVKGFEAEI